MSSEYGDRYDPNLRQVRLHTGIDFGKEGIGTLEGESVYATNAGTVIKSGWSSGYGFTVVVQDINGEATLYAHLDSITANLRKGDIITESQVLNGFEIGKVGNTECTDPHLHFEILPKNSADTIKIEGKDFYNLDGTPKEGEGNLGIDRFATRLNPRLYLAKAFPTTFPTRVDTFDNGISVESDHRNNYVVGNTWNNIFYLNAEDRIDNRPSSLRGNNTYHVTFSNIGKKQIWDYNDNNIIHPYGKITINDDISDQIIPIFGNGKYVINKDPKTNILNATDGKWTLSTPDGNWFELTRGLGNCFGNCPKDWGVFFGDHLEIKIGGMENSKTIYLDNFFYPKVAYHEAENYEAFGINLNRTPRKEITTGSACGPSLSHYCDENIITSLSNGGLGTHWDNSGISSNNYGFLQFFNAEGEPEANPFVVESAVSPNSRPLFVGNNFVCNIKVAGLGKFDLVDKLGNVQTITFFDHQNAEITAISTFIEEDNDCFSIVYNIDQDKVVNLPYEYKRAKMVSKKFNSNGELLSTKEKIIKNYETDETFMDFRHFRTSLDIKDSSGKFAVDCWTGDYDTEFLIMDTNLNVTNTFDQVYFDIIDTHNGKYLTSIPEDGTIKLCSIEKSSGTAINKVPLPSQFSDVLHFIGSNNGISTIALSSSDPTSDKGFYLAKVDETNHIIDYKLIKVRQPTYIRVSGFLENDQITILATSYGSQEKIMFFDSNFNPILKDSVTPNPIPENISNKPLIAQRNPEDPDAMVTVIGDANDNKISAGNVTNTILKGSFGNDLLISSTAPDSYTEMWGGAGYNTYKILPASNSTTTIKRIYKTEITNLNQTKKAIIGEIDLNSFGFLQPEDLDIQSYNTNDTVVNLPNNQKIILEDVSPELVKNNLIFRINSWLKVNGTELVENYVEDSQEPTNLFPKLQVSTKRDNITLSLKAPREEEGVLFTYEDGNDLIFDVQEQSNNTASVSYDEENEILRVSGKKEDVVNFAKDIKFISGSDYNKNITINFSIDDGNEVVGSIEDLNTLKEELNLDPFLGSNNSTDFVSPLKLIGIPVNDRPITKPIPTLYGREDEELNEDIGKYFKDVEEGNDLECSLKTKENSTIPEFLEITDKCNLHSKRLPKGNHARNITACDKEGLCSEPNPFKLNVIPKVIPPIPPKNDTRNDTLPAHRGRNPLDLESKIIIGVVAGVGLVAGISFLSAFLGCLYQAKKKKIKNWWYGKKEETEREEIELKSKEPKKALPRTKSMSDLSNTGDSFKKKEDKKKEEDNNKTFKPISFTEILEDQREKDSKDKQNHQNLV